MLAGGDGGGGPAWKDGSGKHKAALIDIVVVLHKSFPPPKPTGKWLCWHVLLYDVKITIYNSKVIVDGSSIE